MSSVGVAVFVKTIGLSPIKTRLAASVGQELAEEFYRRSVRAVEAVLRKAAEELAGLQPYWAVAEGGAIEHPNWNGFPRLPQGEDSLGERLDSVLRDLMARHSAGILIGADTPMLDCGALVYSSELLLSPVGPEFVLGPSRDGGFYLFGSNTPIPEECWERVPYSTDQTCRLLRAEISLMGRITELSTLTDVDTSEDLGRLVKDAQRVMPPHDLLAEQAQLLDWISEQFLI